MLVEVTSPAPHMATASIVIVEASTTSHVSTTATTSFVLEAAATTKATVPRLLEPTSAAIMIASTTSIIMVPTSVISSLKATSVGVILLLTLLLDSLHLGLSQVNLRLAQVQVVHLLVNALLLLLQLGL